MMIDMVRVLKNESRAIYNLLMMGISIKIKEVTME